MKFWWLAPAAWASDLFRRQGHSILQLLQCLMLPVSVPDAMIVMVTLPADVRKASSFEGEFQCLLFVSNAVRILPSSCIAMDAVINWLNKTEKEKLGY